MTKRDMHRNMCFLLCTEHQLTTKLTGELTLNINICKLNSISRVRGLIREDKHENRRVKPSPRAVFRNKQGFLVLSVPYLSNGNSRVGLQCTSSNHFPSFVRSIIPVS